MIVSAYDEATRAVTWTTNTELKARAEHLDGTYLLRTDRQDLSEDEIWRLYILLTRVKAPGRAVQDADEMGPVVMRGAHALTARPGRQTRPVASCLRSSGSRRSGRSPAAATVIISRPRLP